MDAPASLPPDVRMQRRLVVVITGVVALGLAYLLRCVLVPLFLAFLQAYALDPFVDRLEALKRDRVGQHSIRINDQYRICFVWKVDGAHEVEITDYHERTGVARVAINRPASGWNLQRVSTHPGEILRDEFLVPLGITQNALALKIRVPATRIGDIIHGKRAITPDTALRLARFFGNRPEFWLNLQQMHDLSNARLKSNKTIERDVEAYTGAR